MSDLYKIIINQVIENNGQVELKPITRQYFAEKDLDLLFAIADPYFKLFNVHILNFQIQEVITT